MNVTHLFIDPVDTLILRGNKLFGDPGSFGESLVPPWPSVAAGALRSALLTYRGWDPVRFGRGEIDDPELGTPARPGSFAVVRFQLALRNEDGTAIPLYGAPADLSVTRRNSGDGLEVRRIRPCSTAHEIQTSAITSSLAVLAEPHRSKLLSGLWLKAEGWAQHLGDSAVNAQHLVESVDLWKLDTRIGIALDPKKRRAADGALFTSQGIAFRKSEQARRDGCKGKDGIGQGVGFLASVTGVTLPDALTLRFGGDGRAALATQIPFSEPQVDYAEIANSGRCRLILATPGLFQHGWLPTGAMANGRDLRFDLHGVRGRIICATVQRAEVVSGFDIAKGRPKPAQRVAPTGSVYWLEELNATAGSLRNLAARGLWSEKAEDAVRRAEGFNRIVIGAY